MVGKSPTLLVTDEASGVTQATTIKAFLQDNGNAEECLAAIRFLNFKFRFGRYDTATIGGGASPLFTLQYDEEGRFCSECFADVLGNDPHAPECDHCDTTNKIPRGFSRKKASP